jgi:hypothetical protein
LLAKPSPNSSLNPEQGYPVQEAFQTGQMEVPDGITGHIENYPAIVGGRNRQVSTKPRCPASLGVRDRQSRPP